MTMKTKILLVDDEPLVREELGGLLEDEGYAVIRGTNGAEGLQLFHDRHPDMVFTDVRMPRGDGISLALAIRRASPTVPVTVITGHGTEQMAIDALRAGVTDFIKKPVRLEDLTAALQRMETTRQLAHREPTRLPTSAELLERRCTYRLANDPAAVPVFVDTVLNNCGAKLDPAAIVELSLAVRELVLNAIEHGNLGLTYSEKSKALEGGTLAAVLAQRGAVSPYAARKTSVTTVKRSDEVVIEVADDGDGFDWRALPDPTDPQNLLEAHGRGVLLARMSVDRLTFSEKGNCVTVVKKIPAE